MLLAATGDGQQQPAAQSLADASLHPEQTGTRIESQNGTSSAQLSSGSAMEEGEFEHGASAPSEHVRVFEDDLTYPSHASIERTSIKGADVDGSYVSGDKFMHGGGRRSRSRPSAARARARSSSRRLPRGSYGAQRPSGWEDDRMRRARARKSWSQREQLMAKRLKVKRGQGEEEQKQNGAAKEPGRGLGAGWNSSTRSQSVSRGRQPHGGWAAAAAGHGPRPRSSSRPGPGAQRKMGGGRRTDASGASADGTAGAAGMSIQERLKLRRSMQQQSQQQETEPDKPSRRGGVQEAKSDNRKPIPTDSSAGTAPGISIHSPRTQSQEGQSRGSPSAITGWEREVAHQALRIAMASATKNRGSGESPRQSGGGQASRHHSRRRTSQSPPQYDALGPIREDDILAVMESLKHYRRKMGPPARLRKDHDAAPSSGTAVDSSEGESEEEQPTSSRTRPARAAGRKALLSQPSLPGSGKNVRSGLPAMMMQARAGKSRSEVPPPVISTGPSPAGRTALAPAGTAANKADQGRAVKNAASGASSDAVAESAHGAVDGGAQPQGGALRLEDLESKAQSRGSVAVGAVREPGQQSQSVVAQTPAGQQSEDEKLFAVLRGTAPVDSVAKDGETIAEEVSPAAPGSSEGQLQPSASTREAELDYQIAPGSIGKNLVGDLLVDSPDAASAAPATVLGEEDVGVRGTKEPKQGRGTKGGHTLAMSRGDVASQAAAAATPLSVAPPLPASQFATPSSDASDFLSPPPPGKTPVSISRSAQLHSGRRNNAQRQLHDESGDSRASSAAKPPLLPPSVNASAHSNMSQEATEELSGTGRSTPPRALGSASAVKESRYGSGEKAERARLQLAAFLDASGVDQDEDDEQDQTAGESAAESNGQHQTSQPVAAAQATEAGPRSHAELSAGPSTAVAASEAQPTDAVEESRSDSDDAADVASDMAEPEATENAEVLQVDSQSQSQIPSPVLAIDRSAAVADGTARGDPRASAHDRASAELQPVEPGIMTPNVDDGNDCASDGSAGARISFEGGEDENQEGGDIGDAEPSEPAKDATTSHASASASLAEQVPELAAAVNPLERRADGAGASAQLAASTAIAADSGASAGVEASSSSLRGTTEQGTAPAEGSGLVGVGVDVDSESDEEAAGGPGSDGDTDISSRIEQMMKMTAELGLGDSR